MPKLAKISLMARYRVYHHRKRVARIRRAAIAVRLFISESISTFLYTRAFGQFAFL